jgi:phage baseplate assembly protein W
MARGINIKFPFKDTQNGGAFEVNRDTSNALKDDLISLLTTKRGQRPMRPTLFSPIYDYIMEPMDDFIKKQIQMEVEHKIEEFIPQVTVTKIDFTENQGSSRHMGQVDESQNLLTIKIFFRIDTSFGIEDSIILNIPREHDASDEHGNFLQ